MFNGLEKILNLAKKTGDNVIVFNPAKPNDSYVILALNSYERMLENSLEDDLLTEDDLGDKINPDINPWDDIRDDFAKDENLYSNQGGFLPEDVFDSPAEDWEEKTVGATMEDQWEEEVNYLYPVEESTVEKSGVAVAAEETTEEMKNGFDSVADILGSKKDDLTAWNNNVTDEEIDSSSDLTK